MEAVQIKMARAALNLSIEDLATQAGLPVSEVQRLESGAPAADDTTEKLRVVLAAGGVELIGSDAVRFTGDSSPAAAITVEQMNSYNDK